MTLLCIFLILIPGIYLVWANDFGLRSTIADYIALSMFPMPIIYVKIAIKGLAINDFA